MRRPYLASRGSALLLSFAPALALGLVLALAVASPTRALPAPPGPAPLPGTFVRADELRRCPALSHRPVPAAADDVRPDDFSVVMALGDSISAALLAKPEGWDIWRARTNGARDGPPATAGDAASGQAVLALPPLPPPVVEEHRGLSYVAGGDPGAVTLPNIFAHFAARNVSGASVGHHPPVSCLTGCGHPEDDGLNAAVSGSTAGSLVGQARDYLIPAYEALDKADGWAYLSLGIGSNDLCAFCMTCVGSPEKFAQGIKDAVQLVRNRVPKLIVNIMGLWRISAIYELTRRDPYCAGPLRPPVPHLPLECSCAMLPGRGGDYTRARMDELADAYDAAVLRVVRAWAAEADDSFAALWQPGTAVDLEHYPISALSPLDCFHPSAAAHARLAAGVWNRLTLSRAERAIPLAWEDDIWVRCPEEGDRLQVREHY